MTLALNWFDHSPVSAVNAALQLNRAQLSATQDQTFWATPNRFSTDTTQDVLEIDITTPKLVNTLSFDTARFPHTIIIETFNPETSVWSPIIDAQTGATATITILQSVPPKLPNVTIVPGHLHPQHSYSGHWETISLDLIPVTMSKLRLRLQRTNVVLGPQNFFGQSITYSLAIANLVIGYQVSSPADVPRTAPSSTNSYDSFASTDDLFGSSIDFVLRSNRAVGILGNTDESADTIWLSEPQPYANAVVNLYADLRDTMGNAQILDWIYIDPITNGAHITVYYSNDQPVGGFNSVADPLTSTQASLTNTASVVSDHLHLGNYGEHSYATVDNGYLGFDPSLPWWLGVQCQPLFLEGIDGAEHPIFSCASFRVSLTATGLLLSTATDQVVLPVLYNPLQNLTIIASYDGISLRLRAVSSNDDEQLSLPVTTVIPQQVVPTLYLGYDPVQNTYGNVDLYSFVLKEEILQDDSFLQAPHIYSSVAQYPNDDLNSENALLRLDPTNALVSTDYPTALFGGPANKFAAMTWTPVPRDFSMQRGAMHLPTIKARFIDLEITNLQPNYQDVYQPIKQTVQTFPPDILQDYRDAIAASTGAPQNIGLATMANQTSNTPYSDFPVYISTGGTQTGYTNTEVYVASDYDAANRLYAAQGWMWGYQNWHSSTTAPRFDSVGTHTYAKSLVTSTTKVAYGVGLRRIAFARSMFTGQEEAPQYDETLFDQINLASNGWVYDPLTDSLSSPITSGGAVKAITTSASFPSMLPVRGVQFAAQQSEAQQLLPDPDFDDDAHTNWNFVGDAQAAPGVIVSPQIGSVLPVQRQVSVGYWNDISSLYTTWNGLTSNSITYGKLVNITPQAMTFGGVASNPVAQPTGGRLYAAARVYAPQTMTDGNQLFVRIMDASTDAVLAEQSTDVQKNQITEWYVEYPVGAGGAFTANTWGLVDGQSVPTWPTFTDSFTRPDATALGTLPSGQNWQPGGAGSLHIVSNDATVTVANQQSYVDTGTLWGLLTVTLTNAVTTTTPSASVPVLDLGGYWLMNDGRVVSTTTTNAITSLFTLTAGDILTFNFMPTKNVPTVQQGGADVILTPYAVIISRNGTFVRTLVGSYGFSTMRGLLGAVGQVYTSFAWAPSTVQAPFGEVSPAMPMPTNGTLSGDATVWTTGTGEQWSLTNTWAFTQNAAYLGAAPTATLTGTGAGSVTHDYGQVYGSLVFNVTALPAGVTTSTYSVAVLDLTANSLLLRADGAVVRQDGTVIKTGVIPTIVNGTITVRYLNPAILTSVFKTTWGISGTDTQALVFLQNNTVYGVVSGTTLITGTVRGIAGYNDGAGHTTVIEGFGWAPVAYQLALSVGQKYWSDVDQNDTLSWGQMSGQTSPLNDLVYVEVIQKNASNDVWFVHDISLFADTIDWSFSNDGGNVWVLGSDARNNPNGVVLFPPIYNPDATYTVNTAGNQLLWRVTAWSPDVTVSHLAIRPWYQGFLRGVPIRPTFSQHGPNINSYDHYPPIEDDPRFTVWSSPIPRSWWFRFRSKNSQLFSSEATSGMLISETLGGTS